MNKVYETYIPYQLLIPQFFNSEIEPVSVNKVYWWICRLMFWRYRMNYELNLLVQLNNYTRPKHFTDDYLRESTWDETMESLKNIAR